MINYDEIISAKFQELLSCSIVPMSTVDKDSIKLAFDISSDAYQNTNTKDGKPFILYNLDIAIIAIKSNRSGTHFRNLFIAPWYRYKN